MDFIETLFHISPDGGNGATEIALVLAPVLVATLYVQFRLFRKKRHPRA